MAVAPARQPITAGATRVPKVGFAAALTDGAKLTGTPTVVEVTTTDLTLSNKAVSTTALTIDGESVAIGEAVVFSVSGQVSGTTYNVKITVSTDESPSQTFVETVVLECL